jgi:structure-specific recognition protein 1
MQFPRDEELEINVNLPEDRLRTKFNGNLSSKYQAPTSQVVSSVFNAVTNLPIQATTDYRSSTTFVSIACSLKANEGQLYPLKDCLIFLTKPVTLMPYDQIQFVTFSRVGGSGTARTCELTVQMKKGGISYGFNGVMKEEHPILESWLKARSIRVKNEMAEDNDKVLVDASSDDDDEVASANDAVRMDDDEDESEDEDYVGEESSSSSGEEESEEEDDKE